jgi:acyl-CoA thioesterase
MSSLANPSHQGATLQDHEGLSHGSGGAFGADLHPFDRSLALARRGEGVFVGDIDASWNVVRGPNGGYLAALLLRAMQLELGDAARRPRVLTAHYPSVPKPGPVEIRARVERAGRSVSWLAAELMQNGELHVAARCAFSSDWPSLQYDRTQAPAVDAKAPGLKRFPGMPPFTQHYEYRSLFASPAAPKTHPQVGGYIRTASPRRLDAPLVTALSDAWFPSTFAHDGRFVMAATLDLTVHFRNHAALEAQPEHAFVLSVFRSQLATEGFFEEDGELFSEDGVLIAQSRQLAIARPF